jgi:hypothetical protein
MLTAAGKITAATTAATLLTLGLAGGGVGGFAGGIRGALATGRTILPSGGEITMAGAGGVVAASAIGGTAAGVVGRTSLSLPAGRWATAGKILGAAALGSLAGMGQFLKRTSLGTAVTPGAVAMSPVEAHGPAAELAARARQTVYSRWLNTVGIHGLAHALISEAIKTPVEGESDALGRLYLKDLEAGTLDAGRLATDALGIQLTDEQARKLRGEIETILKDMSTHGNYTGIARIIKKLKGMSQAPEASKTAFRDAVLTGIAVSLPTFLMEKIRGRHLPKELPAVPKREPALSSLDCLASLATAATSQTPQGNMHLALLTKTAEKIETGKTQAKTGNIDILSGKESRKESADIPYTLGELIFKRPFKIADSEWKVMENDYKAWARSFVEAVGPSTSVSVIRNPRELRESLREVSGLSGEERIKAVKEALKVIAPYVAIRELSGTVELYPKKPAKEEKLKAQGAALRGFTSFWDSIDRVLGSTGVTQPPKNSIKLESKRVVSKMNEMAERPKAVEEMEKIEIMSFGNIRFKGKKRDLEVIKSWFKSKEEGKKNKT